VTEFPKIVFDVDNVLANTMKVFCEKASKLIGFEVTKKQIRSHKIVGSIPLPPETIFRIQTEVWSDWAVLPVLERNLYEKMDSFKKIGFEVYIATAVPSKLVPYVEKWIRSKRIPFSKFFHCSKKRPKSLIQAEALVDDSPEEVRRFVSSRRQGFLYRQPWNINSKVAKAIVVQNLDDVLRHYGVEKGENGVYRDIRWSGNG